MLAFRIGRVCFGTTKRQSRSFFSLPKDIQTYQATRILPYTQKELYNVVADVDSYHRFVPYCTKSRVLSRPETNDEPYLMELTVGFLGVQQTYVSKVLCKPYESVEATASDEIPVFKFLKSVWSFQPETTSSQPSFLPSFSSLIPPSSPSASTQPSTKLTLDIVFSFTNPMHAALSGAFIGQVSDKMIHAFESRCADVYRRP